VIVLAVAFALTTGFNRARVPTSTIQILVFTVGGVAVGAGTPVHWAIIGQLAGVWAAAPLAAAAAGYALTRLLDLAPGMRVAAAAPGLAAPAAPAASPPAARPAGDVPAGAGETPPAGVDLLGLGLIAVGGVASFAMGANDVANAAGSLVGTGTFSALLAGLIGGAGLALGVLTWGRPLLAKVAFDIVTVDRPMATAAQLVQGAVVLAAVGFGYFTSMNQALIGAMAGAGLARGQHTVHRKNITGILRGWLAGPAAGFTLGYLLTLAIAAAAGAHTLVSTG
jgi:PiT family inorganic phosphate transporter